MESAKPHDRRYLQNRVIEEIGRGRRHGRPFSLLIFEAQAVSDGIPMRRKMDAAIEIMTAQLRPCDIVARAFDDVIVALLVETDAAGMKDALLRLRGRLSPLGGTTWRIKTYTYPDQEEVILGLEMLKAA